MKAQLIALAERAGEHWRENKRLAGAQLLVTAALLTVFAALALAAASFSASILAVIAGTFAAGMAAGVLIAFTVASWRLRDTRKGGPR